MILTVSTKNILRSVVEILITYTLSSQYIVDELTEWTCIVEDELDDSTTRHVSVTIDAAVSEQNWCSASNSIDVHTICTSRCNVVVSHGEDRLEEVTGADGRKHSVVCCVFDSLSLMHGSEEWELACDTSLTGCAIARHRLVVDVVSKNVLDWLLTDCTSIAVTDSIFVLIAHHLIDERIHVDGVELIKDGRHGVCLCVVDFLSLMDARAFWVACCDTSSFVHDQRLTLTVIERLSVARRWHAWTWWHWVEPWVHLCLSVLLTKSSTVWCWLCTGVVLVVKLGQQIIWNFNTYPYHQFPTSTKPDWHRCQPVACQVLNRYPPGGTVVQPYYKNRLYKFLTKIQGSPSLAPIKPVQDRILTGCRHKDIICNHNKTLIAMFVKVCFSFLLFST